MSQFNGILQNPRLIAVVMVPQNGYSKHEKQSSGYEKNLHGAVCPEQQKHRRTVMPQLIATIIVIWFVLGGKMW